MTERSSPNNASLALFAGLVGFGIGLLFAPRSGKETRDKVKERAHEMKDSATDSLHDAKEKVNSKLEHTRDSLSSAIKTTGRRAKQKYDEFESVDSSDRPTSRQSPVLHTWEEEV